MKSAFAHKLVIALATLVAAGFLCAGSSKALSASDKLQLTEAEKQAPLLAVARTGGFILAANSNGFFRAGTSSGKWQRIAIPTKVPIDGQFTASEANSNLVYFWFQSAPKTKGALYLSQDSGLTWELLNDSDDFRFVYPDRYGKIYAIRRGVRSRLVLSNDGGKSWEDITGNIFGDLYSVFADPRSPNKICVLGSTIRGYIFEQTDNSYANWTATPDFGWRNDSKTDDEFLQGGYITGSALYMLRATLSNYFHYNFGSSTTLPAFEISLDTNRLTFKSGDKIEVPITIQFREPGFNVKLPDAKNGEEMWSVQMIDPSGERINSNSKANRLGKPDTESLRQQYRALPDFTVTTISTTNSYSRPLLLSKLAEFSKPGNYRMRLWYQSGGWSWEREANGGHSIKTDLWDGTFCSSIFTLTIKP